MTRAGDHTCSRTKDAPPTDLFAQTFGPQPKLLPVLGSEEAVEKLYYTIKGSTALANMKSAEF